MIASNTLPHFNNMQSEGSDPGFCNWGLDV